MVSLFTFNVGCAGAGAGTAAAAAGFVTINKNVLTVELYIPSAA